MNWTALARGHLDAYLKSYLRPAVGHQNLAAHIAQTQGRDGNPNQPLGVNEVLGRFSEPALQARYQHQQQRRQAQASSHQSEQDEAFNRAMAQQDDGLKHGQ